MLEEMDDLVQSERNTLKEKPKAIFKKGKYSNRCTQIQTQHGGASSTIQGNSIVSCLVKVIGYIRF